jgi:hypothetical protein
MSLDAPLAEHEQLVEGLGPFRLVRDHEHAGAAAAGGGDELGEERPGAGRVEVSDGLVHDEEAAPASIGRLIFQGGHGAGSSASSRRASSMPGRRSSSSR